MASDELPAEISAEINALKTALVRMVLFEASHADDSALGALRADIGAQLSDAVVLRIDAQLPSEVVQRLADNLAAARNDSEQIPNAVQNAKQGLETVAQSAHTLQYQIDNQLRGLESSLAAGRTSTDALAECVARCNPTPLIHAIATSVGHAGDLEAKLANLGTRLDNLTSPLSRYDPALLSNALSEGIMRATELTTKLASAELSVASLVQRIEAMSPPSTKDLNFTPPGFAASLTEAPLQPVETPSANGEMDAHALEPAKRPPKAQRLATTWIWVSGRLRALRAVRNSLAKAALISLVAFTAGALLVYRFDAPQQPAKAASSLTQSAGGTCGTLAACQRALALYQATIRLDERIAATISPHPAHDPRPVETGGAAAALMSDFSATALAAGALLPDLAADHAGAAALKSASASIKKLYDAFRKQTAAAHPSWTPADALAQSELLRNLAEECLGARQRPAAQAPASGNAASGCSDPGNTSCRT